MQQLEKTTTMDETRKYGMWWGRQGWEDRRGGLWKEAPMVLIPAQAAG